MPYPISRYAVIAYLIHVCLPLSAADNDAVLAEKDAVVAEELQVEQTSQLFSDDQQQERMDAPAEGKYKDYLLGDVWGARSDLERYGMDFNVSFALNLAGNPVGGRTQAFTQTNSTGIDYGIDFEKLAGWEGLTFFSSMAIRSGSSLSQEYLGNVINVQQLYGNQTYRLVDLYFEQALFDETFGLKAGRIAQFDDFSHSTSFGYYMNNAFDGQPVGFFFMGPFTAYPVSTWGALARGGLLTGEQDGIYAMVGAYGADSSLPDPGNHGTDFSFDFNNGANIMVELGYKHDWAENTNGNPGKYAVGGWWFTGPFQKFSGGQADGAGGIFYFIHQNLYNENSVDGSDTARMSNRRVWETSDAPFESVQGLFFFSTGQFASDTDVSQSDWFVSNGFYYRGLLPDRDKDVLSIACAYLSYGEEWGQSQVRRGQLPQIYEVELELSYRYVVTDYFYVQPNIQGIINPQARGSLPDALVLGLQLQVDF